MYFFFHGSILFSHGHFHFDNAKRMLHASIYYISFEREVVKNETFGRLLRLNWAIWGGKVVKKREKLGNVVYGWSVM